MFTLPCSAPQATHDAVGKSFVFPLSFSDGETSYPSLPVKGKPKGKTKLLISAF